MKCPKCGGEIPFYNLKPNCMHCGVNIMYYTQEEGLIRDAKRTELEGAVARMVIARIKASFIGSKLVIVRLVFTVLAAAALLVPYGGARYVAPLFDENYSVGIIGIIKGFQNGFILKLPSFLGSEVFGTATKIAMIPTVFFLIVTILDILIFGALLLSFLNIEKGTTFMKNTAVVGASVSIIGQIAVLAGVLRIEKTFAAVAYFGFGALVSLAMFIVLFILNRIVLKKGIEPTYRENDLKRRDTLKKVRAGEINLDDLSLPVFESEEEREARLKALEEALKAEEEGKEL